MNMIWAMAVVITVQAEENPSEITLSPTAKARAISLQVRGVVPTLEELNANKQAGTIEESLNDEWLDSPE